MRLVSSLFFSFSARPPQLVHSICDTCEAPLEGSDEAVVRWLCPGDRPPSVGGTSGKMISAPPSRSDPEYVTAAIGPDTSIRRRNGPPPSELTTTISIRSGCISRWKTQCANHRRGARRSQDRATVSRSLGELPSSNRIGGHPSRHLHAWTLDRQASHLPTNLMKPQVSCRASHVCDMPDLKSKDPPEIGARGKPPALRTGPREFCRGPPDPRSPARERSRYLHWLVAPAPPSRPASRSFASDPSPHSC